MPSSEGTEQFKKQEAEYHNRTAEKYEDEVQLHTWRVRLGHQAIYSHLKSLVPEGSRILELGGGTGEDCKEISKLGFRVVCTDIAINPLRIARQNTPPPSSVCAMPRTYPSRIPISRADSLLGRFNIC